MVEIADSAGWIARYTPKPARIASEPNTISPPASGAASRSHYYIDVELPGVSLDDIEIILDEERIFVRGVKKAPQRDAERNYFFSEIETGSFQRTFKLPYDVDHAAIEASVGDGVLSIRIPRTASASASGRKIPIRMREQTN
jgi:HSP20 family protein